MTELDKPLVLQLQIHLPTLAVGDTVNFAVTRTSTGYLVGKSNPDGTPATMDIDYDDAAWSTGTQSETLS